MDRKRLWLSLDAALIALSLAFLLFCLRHHDPRLPMAAFCTAGSIVVYLRERNRGG